jgi:hypothetical protein
MSVENPESGGQASHGVKGGEIGIIQLGTSYDKTFDSKRNKLQEQQTCDIVGMSIVRLRCLWLEGSSVKEPKTVTLRLALGTCEASNTWVGTATAHVRRLKLAIGGWIPQRDVDSCQRVDELRSALHGSGTFLCTDDSGGKRAMKCELSVAMYAVSSITGVTPGSDRSSSRRAPATTLTHCAARLRP